MNQHTEDVMSIYVRFQDILELVAEETGLEPERVRAVLQSFASAIRMTPPGRIVKTPLGAFKWRHIKARAIRRADGVIVPTRERIKMTLSPKPSRLVVHKEDPSWGVIWGSWEGQS
jgi:hypothetical protein